MKTIKIKFVGWYPGFDSNDNSIIRILQKRYHVELSDNPDYLICGVYGEPLGKEALKYDGVRIFLTGESVAPDFNFYDYAIGFDELSFGDRYFRMPLCCRVYNDRKKKLIDERASFSREDLRAKSFFASFVYSNKYGQKEREIFFNMMNAYKPVASAGGFLNNMNGERCKDKLEFQAKSKFVIAFENGIYDGYTTEKLLDAFASKAIPIYYGNPKVDMDFISGSYINCHEYDSFSEVMQEVKRIDQDDDAYLEMMHSSPLAYDFSQKKKEYEEYLYHIFDQDKESAYRRNTSLFGTRLERVEKKKMACYPVSHLYSNRITDTISYNINRMRNERNKR